MMNTKRYKPLIDKYFYIIWVPLSILLIALTILALSEVIALILMILIDVFCWYFMISQLTGYVELRESSMYVRFGFILRKNIPYNKIKEFNKERRIITYSYLSLKNALEHINIKYNKFDMITVSVVNNDDLIKELEERTSK